MTSDHSTYRYSDELPGDEEMIPHLHVRPEDREKRGKGKKDREKREREEAALPKLSCTLSYKDFPPYDYLYRDRISSQTHGVPIGVSLLDHEQAPEDATEEVVLTYLRVVFMTWDRSGNVRLQIAPFNYEGKDVSTLRTKEPYPSPRVAKPTGYSTFLVEELRGLNGRNLERAVFNRPEHARWNPLLQYYPSFDAMKTASYRKDSILAAQNRLTNGSYHIPGFHGEEDEEVIEAMDCVARIEKIMTDGLDLIKDSVVRHPSFNPTHAQEVVLAGSRVQDQLLRELSRIQCEHRFDLRDLRREKPSERLPMDTQPELMPDPTVCVSPTLRKSYVQCVKEGVSYPTKKLLAGKPLKQSLIQRLIAAPKAKLKLKKKPASQQILAAPRNTASDRSSPGLFISQQRKKQKRMSLESPVRESLIYRLVRPSDADKVSDEDLKSLVYDYADFEAFADVEKYTSIDKNLVLLEESLHEAFASLACNRELSLSDPFLREALQYLRQWFSRWDSEIPEDVQKPVSENSSAIETLTADHSALYQSILGQSALDQILEESILGQSTLDQTLSQYFFGQSNLDQSILLDQSTHSQSVLGQSTLDPPPLSQYALDASTIKQLVANQPLLEEKGTQKASGDQPPESEAKNKPRFIRLNRQQRNRVLECFLRGGDDTLTVMDTIRSINWGKGLLRELEGLLGRPAKILIAQEVLEKAANTLMKTQDPHEIHKCRDRIHSALRPTEEEVVELFLDTSIEEAAPKIAPMLWRCCSVKEALDLIERGVGLDENSLQDRTEIASMMESFRGEGTGGDVASFIRDLQSAVWTEQAKKLTNKQGR